MQTADELGAKQVHPTHALAGAPFKSKAPASSPPKMKILRMVNPLLRSGASTPSEFHKNQAVHGPAADATHSFEIRFIVGVGRRRT
jgi:hypothetical protein